MAETVKTRYAIATSSGTTALHTALLVAGVEPEDEVLVSTLTFIAPVNAIRYIGAWPVLIDAEPDYLQMDAKKMVGFFESECVWKDGRLQNKNTGRRVKAIVPVHILGHPCDMDPIIEAARKYDLVVIEDASESLGARYKGRTVGSLGDMACFSFNGNKIITSGGGGMITTDNEEWAARAKYLTTQAVDDPAEYVHGEIGYNYRLTNIQAAMGCAQIEQLEDHVATKRRIAAAYTEALQKIDGLEPMNEASWAESTFWMYTMMVDGAVFGSSSRELTKRLGSAGIQTRPLWQPMHRSPAHGGAVVCRMDNADDLYARGVSLPCSVGLTTEQADRVICELAMSATPPLD